MYNRDIVELLKVAKPGELYSFKDFDWGELFSFIR